jgi:hypothetical protein
MANIWSQNCELALMMEVSSSSMPIAVPCPTGYVTQHILAFIGSIGLLRYGDDRFKDAILPKLRTVINVL